MKNHEICNSSDLTEEEGLAYKLLTSPLLWLFFGLFLSTAAALGKPMQSDEAVWSYMGRLWVEYKAPPYIGAVDNKTPGVYYLYYVSHLLFGLNLWFPRIVGAVAIAAGGFGIYSILRKLEQNTAAILAAILFYLIMPTNVVGGESTSQTETFMVCFVVFSFLALIHSKDFSGYRYRLYVLLSGFLMGWAIAFKQIAIFDTAALFALVFYLTARRNIKSLLADFVLLASGILIAQAVSIVPLLLSGVTVWDYIYEAWLCLLQPGSGTMDMAIRIDHFFDAFLDLRLVIPYLCIIGFLRSGKRYLDKMPLRSFWILWLILGFVGVNASGYYVSHQVKQIIPPLCIISGLFFDYLTGIIKYNYGSSSLLSSRKYNILFIIIVLMFVYIAFEKRYWDTSSHRDCEKAIYVGHRVGKLSNKEDFVLFWGARHQVITCSNRRSPSRYFHTLFVERPGAQQEIQNAVSNTPPAVIVIDKGKKVPEWLKRKIQAEYAFHQRIFSHDIFVTKRY